MRHSTVSDLKKLLKHYRINLLRGLGMDVGGTVMVNLDGKTELNPLLKIKKNIQFLDRGFNIDTLNTEADEVVDFLDSKSIAHLKNKYNFVSSFDTLEHISNPLKFCENLISITKPAGYIYLATVFDWPYHPSPEDYFRFSPSGLRELFTSPSNHLSKQINIVWCGWGSDPRGVCLIIQKKSQQGKHVYRKNLEESWLLKKNKKVGIITRAIMYFTDKIKTSFIQG